MFLSATTNYMRYRDIACIRISADSIRTDIFDVILSHELCAFLEFALQDHNRDILEVIECRILW